MTLPQVSPTSWFHRRCEDLFLRQFTTFLILVKVPLEDSFQEVLSRSPHGLQLMVSVLSQLTAEKGSNPYPLQQIPVPGRRFSHIHVDLVGPPPQSCGYTFLFTIIERTSRWPETISLQSTTAEECANVLLCSWFPTFKVPAVITSDHGAQFTSSIRTSLCRVLGIMHSLTTSFRPQRSFIIVSRCP